MALHGRMGPLAATEPPFSHSAICPQGPSLPPKPPRAAWGDSAGAGGGHPERPCRPRAAAMPVHSPGCLWCQKVPLCPGGPAGRGGQGVRGPPQILGKPSHGASATPHQLLGLFQGQRRPLCPTAALRPHSFSPPLWGTGSGGPDWAPPERPRLGRWGSLTGGPSDPGIPGRPGFPWGPCKKGGDPVGARRPGSLSPPWALGIGGPCPSAPPHLFPWGPHGALRSRQTLETEKKKRGGVRGVLEAPPHTHTHRGLEMQFLLHKQR